MRSLFVVPRSPKAASLAGRRELKIAGKIVAATPILVPSFSSKGFPDIADLVVSASEIITDTCLVSAYDVHYKQIETDVSFAEFVFLDSGGYESSKDFELSDLGRVLPRR